MKNVIFAFALIGLIGAGCVRATAPSPQAKDLRLPEGVYTGITGDVKDLTGPVSGKPCVFYEFVASSRKPGDEGENFLGRFKSLHAAPFMVEGRTQFVNIKEPEIDRARWSKDGYAEIAVTPGAESAGIRNLLAEMKVDTAMLGKGDELVLAEWCILARHPYRLTVDEVGGSYLKDDEVVTTSRTVYRFGEVER